MVLALLATAVALAQEITRVEFSDLPHLVNEKNQHVSGARLRMSGTENLTGHLGRSFLPTLDAHIGGERFNTGPFDTKNQAYGGIEARWNVFRGGRDYLEEKARAAQVEVARAEFTQSQLDEITKARSAFWEMVYQREVTALLQAALEQNEANLAAANRRIQGGVATPTDRIEFEMYRVQLQQDLARATLGTANAQRNLNVLIGQSEHTPIDTIKVIPHEHDDALLTSALNPSTHRDVKALSANSDVAAQQKSSAYRWWTPSVDLYGGYGLYTLRERDYENRDDRYEPYAGIRLTINIFDGLHSRAQGASFARQAEGLAHQAAQTSRELMARYEGARQELKLTHDLIHSAEESVKKAREYLKRTQAEYVRGAKNSPDVFSATEKYIDLQRRYAELRRDYQFARLQLLSIRGE